MIDQGAADLARVSHDNSQFELPAATIVPRVSSADTAGAYTVMDYIAPPHFPGPSPHWHARTTEWIYVVSGTLAVTLDDETITIERGESFLIPPRVTHTFWNPTAHPAILLVIASPGGIENYYAELAALLAAESYPPARNRIPITTLAARYDILPVETLSDHDSEGA